MTRIAALLPFLVLAACRSDRPAPTPPPAGAPADLEVAAGQVVLPGEDRAVAIEMRAPAGAPDGLRRDAEAGRTWLALRKPRGLSFAGPALLAGGGLLRPARTSVTYARPRGRTEGRHPALWRMEGSVEAADLRARIERLPDTGRTQVAGLSEVRDQDLRILLGRGVDVLMASVGPEHGGHDVLDTHGWGGVTDGADQAVPTERWLDDLARAHGDASLEPLRDRYILVRRWRPSGAPKATWFRLRLDDVAVASQTVLRADPAAESWTWVWEGLWRGEMGPAPARAEPVAGQDAPPLTVRYKEFDPPRRGSATGGLFKVLLAPLALGADFGSSFFDESEDSGILETTAEKQRERRD